MFGVTRVKAFRTIGDFNIYSNGHAQLLNERQP